MTRRPHIIPGPRVARMLDTQNPLVRLRLGLLSALGLASDAGGAIGRLARAGVRRVLASYWRRREEYDYWRGERR